MSIKQKLIGWLDGGESERLRKKADDLKADISILQKRLDIEVDVGYKKFNKICELEKKLETKITSVYIKALTASGGSADAASYAVTVFKDIMEKEAKDV